MADLNPSARQVLLDLADRCEREEPSVKLRIAIAQAVGWTWVQFGYVQWRNPSGYDASLPKFDESLDAAVTLVPEGWFLETLSDIFGDGMVYARLACPDPLREAQGWGARNRALTICAASLRARAEAL